MRHGVDFTHFARAWKEPPARPADLAAIRHPVFGFFGLIHHWIDIALIAEVARLRPDYSFVLIGEAKVDVSELQKLPNVLLAGRRPYEDLPAYCAAFDAAVLPFVHSPMTRSINPIKMYEYLAAGLPVVSTNLPEVRRYAGPITITTTAREFALACDNVLAGDYLGRRKDISRMVESESWSSKVRCLSDLIMERMGLEVRHASMPRCKLAIPQAAPTGTVDAEH
jgi:glycosyltransferase involved in cell wall biosynthesis